MAMNDIIGKNFDRLYVLEFHHKDKKYNKYYKCICRCGNEKVVSGYCLKSGQSKSCGCLQREKTSIINRKDGRSKDKLYKVWLTMKQRCFNSNDKNYKNYGGRGIEVCKEWSDNFASFKTWAYNNGYEQGLSIDRINNDGNYEPSNCRWATKKQQSNNTRRNVFIKYNGQVKTQTEWANTFNIETKEFCRLFRKLKDIDLVLKYFILKKKGLPYNENKHIMGELYGERNTLSYFCKKLKIPYETAVSRIKLYGWDFERALTTPINKNKSQRFYETYKNRTLTISQWAKEFGLNPQNFRYRYHKNSNNFLKTLQYFKIV